MELFRVSFSVGRKGSLSSSSAFDLVTIKWDIWSFRVCNDCTATKKRKKERVIRTGNFQREVLLKGEVGVCPRQVSRNQYIHKALQHMCLTANKYLSSTLQIANLCGVLGDTIVSRGRQQGPPSCSVQSVLLRKLKRNK